LSRTEIGGRGEYQPGAERLHRGSSFQQLHAVHTWHPQVTEHHVKRPDLHALKRLPSAVADLYRRSAGEALSQVATQSLCDRGLVVHEQHASIVCSWDVHR
jgi:hypothetical protein